MYNHNQHIYLIKQYREAEGLCKSCGREKERTEVKHCDRCIALGTRRKAISRKVG